MAEHIMVFPNLVLHKCIVSNYYDPEPQIFQCPPNLGIMPLRLRSVVGWTIDEDAYAR